MRASHIVHCCTAAVLLCLVAPGCEWKAPCTARDADRCAFESAAAWTAAYGQVTGRLGAARIAPDGSTCLVRYLGDDGGGGTEAACIATDGHVVTRRPIGDGDVGRAGRGIALRDGHGHLHAVWHDGTVPLLYGRDDAATTTLDPDARAIDMTLDGDTPWVALVTGAGQPRLQHLVGGDWVAEAFTLPRGFDPIMTWAALKVRDGHAWLLYLTDAGLRAFSFDAGVELAPLADGELVSGVDAAVDQAGGLTIAVGTKVFGRDAPSALLVLLWRGDGWERHTLAHTTLRVSAQPDVPSSYGAFGTLAMALDRSDHPHILAAVGGGDRYYFIPIPGDAPAWRTSVAAEWPLPGLEATDPWGIGVGPARMLDDGSLRLDGVIYHRDNVRSTSLQARGDRCGCAAPE